jgi:hypothetical protein
MLKHTYVGQFITKLCIGSAVLRTCKPCQAIYCCDVGCVPAGWYDKKAPKEPLDDGECPSAAQARFKHKEAAISTA